MNKLIICAILAAAIVSCGESKDKTAVQAVKKVQKVSGNVISYEGVVPSADCPGIRYNLTMLNDSMVSLVRTYIEYDKGRNIVDTIKYKKEKVSKTIKGKNVEGIKLIPTTDTEDILYMTAPDDSTLRIVNENLQEAASELNYDLEKIK